MKENMPCENCITLAICKQRYQKVSDNTHKRTKFVFSLKYEAFNELNNTCSILFEYYRRKSICDKMSLGSILEEIGEFFRKEGDG